MVEGQMHLGQKDAATAMAKDVRVEMADGE